MITEDDIVVRRKRCVYPDGGHYTKLTAMFHLELDAHEDRSELPDEELSSEELADNESRLVYVEDYLRGKLLRHIYADTNAEIHRLKLFMLRSTDTTLHAVALGRDVEGSDYAD